MSGDTSRSRSAPCVILDDPRTGRRLRFAEPVAIIEAHTEAEVHAALDALETARRSGKYAAGYFSYELGYLLEPRLRRHLWTRAGLPLLWFGIFDEAKEIPDTAPDPLLQAPRAYSGPLAHEWDESAYRARFDRVAEFIAAGDIYQANLSFRARFPFLGDAHALFERLREQAGAAHCAFVDDGQRHILSLSPELFFELSANGLLTTRPMKGTAPRGADTATDAALRERLHVSPKDRAENLMIVDLLRNDLGRIAEVGSVRLRELFAVETYPTLHTLVSTIEAQMRGDVCVADIVRALFPCGSVTGAPKIRAMEIIRELETGPRGVYCGAIGHFAPDGSAKFNVAIRTLTIEDGQGELGIGGGVVFDSRSDDEYAECLLKARYYERARRPMQLIETLGYSRSSGIARLDRHLARLAASARAFGIAFDSKTARAAIGNAAHGEALRLRVTLDEEGRLEVHSAALASPPAGLWRYAISPVRVASGDLLLRHKTNWRGLYESEFARLAQETGCDEVLFLNEHGRFAEGSRTNLFILLDGRLATPPLAEGVLDGCLRRELLEWGRCIERELSPREMAAAEKIFLGNSLRGLIHAVPVGRRVSTREFS